MSEETEVRMPEKEDKAAAEAEQGFRSFAEGASDSAQVLDIPQPVPNGQGVRDAEFVIAAAVLSSVGGIFLLIAFFLVWINYMDGFLRGMSMYLVATVLLCVSELAIRKVWPKLSYVLTSIGIGGVYLSTMVNCRSFGHFTEIAELAIVTAFTVLVLLYGWARSVPWYRIVGLLAFYLCLSLGRAGLGERVYFVTIFLGLAVGLFGAALPLKRQVSAVTAVSMLAMVLLFEIPANVDWLGMVQEMVYCMGAMLVLNLLLYRQLDFFHTVEEQGAEAGSSREVGRILCFAVYLASLLFLYLRFNAAALSNGIFSPALQFCMIGIGGICLISFTILWKYKEKWFIYLWMNILAYTVYLTMELRDGGRAGWGGWCLVALLLLSELLALSKVRILRVCRAVLTAIACITVYAAPEQVYVYALLAILLLGILLADHWHAYYELTVTYTLAWFVAKDLPMMLSLPVSAGILFVGILLVNNIKRLRGRMPLAYTWGILSGLIASYLLLMLPVYSYSYLTHFCMLVFGLSVIILVLQEKYHLACNCKLFITELFLAYLVLTVRLNPTVISSILLMAIALAGVGGGFRLRQKSARICGLVFSLLVCGKIVLYDFRGGPTIQRIILFLVTGAAALMIGVIYIILEMKMRDRKISETTGGGE